MNEVPSMNTIDLLTQRDLKDHPATKQELKDVVRYLRWLRAQADTDEKPAKDDLPKKDVKKFLEERGILRKQPQEEERRA